MKLKIIYIPGLGDKEASLQHRAVKFWRHYNVEPELFQMNWADSEPWKAKFARLLARLDEASASGQKLGLVAASAGATAALAAYEARKSKVVGVVLIAGKANRPEFIGQNFRRKNPAFYDAALAASESLKMLAASDRAKILSRYALADEVVYKKDSKIPGAKNRLVFSIGHVITIASQLTLGAPSFLHFLKRLNTRKQSLKQNLRLIGFK